MKKSLIFLCLLFLTLPAGADQVTPSHRVSSHVKVRKNPSLSSSIVGKLATGQSGDLLESIPNWYHIRLPDGILGYVSKDWSELVSKDRSNTTNAVMSEDIISIKSQLRSINEDISKFDGLGELKEQINLLNEKLNDLEFSNYSYAHLDKLNQKYLGYSSWGIKLLSVMVAITSLLLASAAAFLTFYGKKKIEEVYNNMYSLGAIISTSFYRNIAQQCNNKSVDLFRDNPRSAIKYATKALDYLKKANKIKKMSENKGDLVDLIDMFEKPSFDKILYREALYRSNLSFYYANIKNPAMAKEAIRFAKFGLKFGIKDSNLDLIDNYLYVIMKYKDYANQKEIDNAKTIYQSYKLAIDDSESIPKKQRLNYC